MGKKPHPACRCQPSAAAANDKIVMSFPSPRASLKSQTYTGILFLVCFGKGQAMRVRRGHHAFPLGKAWCSVSGM